MDRAGLPFIAGALLPAMALFAVGLLVPAGAFGALGVFFAFFFRDPEREVPVGAKLVVSPADGRVMHAGPADAAVAPAGEWLQVSIFLSPLNVHVNRIPVGGRLTRVHYRPGRFLPAYRPGAATENERNELWIDHDGQTVVCRQVVGVLARRIVCRVPPGAEVATGQRFGIMKFGSRTDLFLPRAADLRVRVGDRVRGGETVVAMLPEN